MKHVLFLSPFLALALSTSSAAQESFVGWQAEAYGTPIVAPFYTYDVNLLSQLADSESPSIAFGGPDVGSKEIDVTFLPIALGGGSEDVAGLALGVEPGFSTDPFADYLLLRWAGSSGIFADDATCTPGGSLVAGLRLYRVHGIPTHDEFWSGADFDVACSPAGIGLELLADASTLANTPWSSAAPYVAHIELGPCSLRIDINGVREFDVTGDFESLSGTKFGLFSMSVPTFASDLTLTSMANPALMESVGVGTMGASRIPSIEFTGCPNDGGGFEFDIMNSSDLVISVGLLGVGPTATAIPLASYAATLYTVPNVYIPITANPGEAFNLQVSLMPDPSLPGVDFFAQAGWLDQAAVGNVAFTNAVRVLVGE